MVLWWTPAAAILTFFSPFTQTSNAYFATWIATITVYLMLSSAFTRVQVCAASPRARPCVAQPSLADALGRCTFSACASPAQVAMQSMSAIQEDANVKALAGLALSSAVVFFGSLEYLGLPADADIDGDGETTLIEQQMFDALLLEMSGVKGEATFALIAGLLSLITAVALYYLVDRKKVGPPVKKGLGASLVLLWVIAAAVLTFDGPFYGTGNGYFGTWVAVFCSVSFAWQEFVGSALPFSVVTSSFAFTPMMDDSSMTPSAPPGSGDVA